MSTTKVKRLSMLKQFDAFGQSVGFTFKQSTLFKTRIGGVTTIICAIIFLCMFAIKTLELLGRTEPFLFMLDGEATEEPIDLYGLGYMFAIEKPNPLEATIVAEQVIRDGNREKRTEI